MNRVCFSQLVCPSHWRNKGQVIDLLGLLGSLVQLLYKAACINHRVGHRIRIALHHLVATFLDF